MFELEKKMDGRGRRAVWDWLAVGLCSLVIFLIAPVARLIQRFVSERWGRPLFGYAVLAAVVLVFIVLAIFQLVRLKIRSWPRLAWLASISAAYIFFTMKLWPNPEEAVHFLEYGALGYFLFRAIRHSIPDTLVCPAAFFAGSLVGILDEILQWILPDRSWDLRDVGLNALAVGLSLLALALGVKPPGVQKTARLASFRTTSILLAANLLLLGMCLSNTPERVEAATRLWPALSFLRNQEPMHEVRLRHQDPRAGRFYSRLTVDWLKKTDLVRADEFGRILRQWKTEDYAVFLRAFPASREPFLHEFRVHVFRRDKKAQAWLEASSGQKRNEDLLAAVKENLILESYFGRILLASSYAWPADKKKSLESQTDLSQPYTSPVSAAPLAGASTAAVWIVVGVLLLLLGLINAAWALTDRKRRLQEKNP